jgi:hypothetical protein
MVCTSRREDPGRLQTFAKQQHFSVEQIGIGVWQCSFHRAELS